MLHPTMSCGVFFSCRSAFQTHALQLVRVIILASFIIFREQLPVCLHHVLLVIPFCVWPSLSTQLMNSSKLLSKCSHNVPKYRNLLLISPLKPFSAISPHSLTLGSQQLCQVPTKCSMKLFTITAYLDKFH